MNERRPVCLTATFFSQVILAGYFLFCFLTAKTRGTNEGYSANFGIGVFIELGVIGLYFTGTLLAIASLIRRESFRAWAFACLALYLLPALFILVAWWRDVDSI